MAEDPLEALDVLTGDLRDFVHTMHAWHADMQKAILKMHEYQRDLLETYGKIMHAHIDVYTMLGSLTSAVWALEQRLEAMGEEEGG
jgi:hypothetical protein